MSYNMKAVYSENGEKVTRALAEMMSTQGALCAGPCTHCGGTIGPDITERPMCYGCGPYKMMPATVRHYMEKAQRLHTLATSLAGQLCARECGKQHYAECDATTKALEADKP